MQQAEAEKGLDDLDRAFEKLGRKTETAYKLIRERIDNEQRSVVELLTADERQGLFQGGAGVNLSLTGGLQLDENIDLEAGSRMRLGEPDLGLIENGYPALPAEMILAHKEKTVRTAKNALEALTR